MCNAILAKLNAQKTGLDTSIQNLKEELTGEEATNSEGEQETFEVENHVLSENGEELGTTVENEEQSETDSVDSTPAPKEAKGYEYAQDQYQIIQDVQEALNSKGFSCTVDGYLGDETSTAITEYQKANGLFVTGNITDELLGSLGV